MNARLGDYSTFDIGGPAPHLVEVKTAEELISLVKENHGKPLLIVGKGSNSLFDDRGFSGLVIVNKIDHLRHTDDLFDVGAGYSFSHLGTRTAREGWAGLEFASGIPGSVGGAIFMNAGANGQETADVLHSVEVLTAEGERRQLMREELSFDYRTSPFQTNGAVILSATFRLTPSKEARKRQLELVAQKTRSQPYHDPSLGCIFRNPPGSSAGALIDQCGLKGHTIGGAQVSSLHANFIINVGGATANDVHLLIDHIKKEVKEQTGIDLQTEVCFIDYE